MSVSTAMVFAAGKGTRMRPLTDALPKPLISIGETTLLDHALAQLRAAHIPNVVINTHYRAPQIEAHTRSIAEPQIALSHEPDLLETGGGIKAANAFLGTSPIITLNADAVWQGQSPILPLLSAWEPQNMGALLLLVPRAQAIGHKGKGDFDLDAEGRLHRPAPGATADYVYTGTQILHPGPVYAFPEKAFSLNKVWDQLDTEGRLHGTLYDGKWCDVGQPESIALAEALL